MQQTIISASMAVVLAIGTIAPAYTAAPDEPKKAAPKAAKAVPAADAPLTLSGCLRADGDRYLLTDMEGVNAPKSRSWKTGFLKKSSKEVEVIGGTPAMKLRDHIGHQVTVSGVSAGAWQIKAKSVKHLAAKCS